MIGKVLNRLCNKIVSNGFVFGSQLAIRRVKETHPLSEKGDAINELLAGTPTAILNNNLTQFNYKGVRNIPLLTAKTQDFALHFNF